MSRIRKSKLKKEVVVNQINEVQVLQQHALLKLNRLMIYGLFVAMFCVITLGFVLMPDGHQTIMANIAASKPVVVNEASFKNPILSAEIEQLKSKLVAIVSGSIESKLESLEESIKLGSILGSLETVHAIKQDVKSLRDYPEPSKPNVNKSQENVVNKVLLQEVSQLRHLIYFTLGSCSLMFAAFSLIWLKNRKILKYQTNFIDVNEHR